MSNNVVDFPARIDPALILRCPCGCLTHYLRADGAVECASCNVPVDHSPNDWRRRLPEAPQIPADVEGGDFIDRDLADESLAQRRVLRSAQDAMGAGVLTAVIVVTADGTVRMWHDDLSGSARQAWFEEKLQTIRGIAMVGAAR